MSEVQSILFDNTQWQLTDALYWLQEHEIIPMKIHETKKHHRFRIKNPKNYSHFITKKLRHGISLVIGFKE